MICTATSRIENPLMGMSRIDTEIKTSASVSNAWRWFEKAKDFSLMTQKFWRSRDDESVKQFSTCIGNVGHNRDKLEVIPRMIIRPCVKFERKKLYRIYMSKWSDFCSSYFYDFLNTVLIFLDKNRYKILSFPFSFRLVIDIAFLRKTTICLKEETFLAWLDNKNLAYISLSIA